MTNIGPSEEQINSIVSILSIGEFKEALEKTDITSPDVPLVANVSALVGNGDPSEIRNSLVEQVTSLVRWRETILWLSKQDVSSVIEIGAGKILSGLNKRIDKHLTSVSIAELEEIENFLIKVESGDKYVQS